MNRKIKAHLIKDPILKKVIQSRKLKPQQKSTLYNALNRSIVGQQLSVKAAATIYKRFLLLFTWKYPTPKKVLAIDFEQLKSCGLSHSKAQYIKNIATYFSKNKTSHLKTLTNEVLVSELTQIKGVGTWTVEMILIFSLHREDVFPIGDLGVRNAMIELYNIKITDKKKQYKKLNEIAERWSPYRSYGARFMWRWLDSTGI